MYQLLIVEDEYSTQRWLSAMIDWQLLGFRIVSVAENGMQALEKLREEPIIDVILTDIRMPVMDGLQLIGEMRLLSLQAEVVILSGYGEFEYARQALQYGVGDYVLKPVSREQLEEVFHQVKQRLDDKCMKAQQLLYAEQLRKEKEVQRKHDFLSAWLVKREEITDLRQKLDKFSVCASNSKFSVVLVQIDNFGIFSKRYVYEEQQLCEFMLMNILNEIAGHYGCAMSGAVGPSRFMFAMAVEAGREADWDPGRIADSFQDAIRKYMKLYTLTISIGCGSLVDRMEQLTESYKQAEQALRYKFMAGHSSISIYSQLPHLNDPSSDLAELEKTAILLLKQFQVEQGLASIRTIFAIAAETMDEDFIKLRVCELLVRLSQAMRELTSISAPNEWLRTFLQEMQQIETYSEFIEAAEKLIRFLVDASLYQQQNRTPVEKGIGYMKLHVHRDLSLQEVADYAGISYSYFSAQFKLETGGNFIDYLVRLRMERAIELLEGTDLTIARIGEELGYFSYRYFAKVFKDFYGITPTRHRDQVNRKSKKNVTGR